MNDTVCHPLSKRPNGMNDVEDGTFIRHNDSNVSIETSTDSGVTSSTPGVGPPSATDRSIKVTAYTLLATISILVLGLWKLLASLKAQSFTVDYLDFILGVIAVLAFFWLDSLKEQRIPEYRWFFEVDRRANIRSASKKSWESILRFCRFLSTVIGTFRLRFYTEYGGRHHEAVSPLITLWRSPGHVKDMPVTTMSSHKDTAPGVDSGASDWTFVEPDGEGDIATVRVVHGGQNGMVVPGEESALSRNRRSSQTVSSPLRTLNAFPRGPRARRVQQGKQDGDAEK